VPARAAPKLRGMSSVADAVPITGELVEIGLRTSKSSSQAEAGGVNWTCTRENPGEPVAETTDHHILNLRFRACSRRDVKSCSMRKPPASGVDSGAPVIVLSLSPDAEDHTVLTAILERSEPLLSGASKYLLRPCATLQSAMAALSQAEIPLVLTERDLATDSWRDVLDNIFLLPDPPILIVTSRLADEYLWAEALNLGAYDVLAKPFDASEVIRVVGSAWRHRTDLRRRISVRNPQPLVATAAA